jgi:succinyl-CoA synthetase alpha subunit
MKRIEIKKNVYYDSVSLMLLTRDIKNIIGIDDANVCMGTAHNKELLDNIGLLNEDAKNTGVNDLIIALKGSDAAITEAIVKINTSETNKKQSKKQNNDYGSLKKAISEINESNMVLISVPGEYAPYEAEIALKSGKHVMMFSDNVSIEEELRLKTIAREKQLLMMGPDCGTAIINGNPLCFANKVKHGHVGIVGASGTGIQEVSTLIHKYGCGITQAIGTGGRDLSHDIGGIMMEMGIDALANDANTQIIVLISKPPHSDIAEKIIAKAKTIDKPFIINFLGEKRQSSDNIRFCATLEETALNACCENCKTVESVSDSFGIPDIMADTTFKPEQKYLRALYTGGTLCDEAMIIASELIGNIYSNTPVGMVTPLEDPYKSKCNSFVDLGDDIFTRGRPHPMIEPDTRNQRIVQESQDPEVAVILLDFVLGYGAHLDPVGVTLPYIKDATKINHNLIFVASLTGTNEDPQNLATQSQMLVDSGVIVASCNAEAAKLATSIVKELTNE